MTERVLGPTGGRRRKRLAILLPFMALGALILAIGASAAGQSAASGFEGSDANLVVDSTFDWNGFNPVTWSTNPGAPYRQASKTATNGWTLTGIEDAQKPANSDDTIFNGGTKQDDGCATVKNQNPPNKDDLKRIYIANATVNNHSYLALAWARIPQNTTSASAHVAFEFNQNKNLCTGTGHDSLVPRSTDNGGDMLIVYDFEGGNGAPVLKLLRWQATGTCEQTGKTATAAGCWVNKPNFTSWEAAVNTQDATDTINPTGITDTLHSQEFGEAIIDLTASGVLDPSNPSGCTSFGRSFAVSRSSGNSGTAQMEDLVGPGDVNITNCATVVVKKVTKDVSGNVITTDSTSFGFSTTVQTLPGPTGVSDFNLTGQPTAGADTKTISSAKPNTGLTVTEKAPIPSPYALDDIGCVKGGSATGTKDVANRVITCSRRRLRRPRRCTRTTRRPPLERLAT
jgi:hypothetical protein